MRGLVVILDRMFAWIELPSYSKFLYNVAWLSGYMLVRKIAWLEQVLWQRPNSTFFLVVKKDKQCKNVKTAYFWY